jgi:small acid-soluble spore protein I (minor)
LGINNYKLTNNIIGDIMNNIDVRKYIINNFKNDSMEEIAESINTSIESKSEDPLIGLGVLFEIMWNNSSNDLRNSILSNIKKGLNYDVNPILGIS